MYAEVESLPMEREKMDFVANNGCLGAKKRCKKPSAAVNAGRHRQCFSLSSIFKVILGQDAKQPAFMLFTVLVHRSYHAPPCAVSTQQNTFYSDKEKKVLGRIICSCMACPSSAADTFPGAFFNLCSKDCAVHKCTR